MKRTTPPKPTQLVTWFSETVLHTPRSSWLDLEQAPMHDPVWPYPPVSSCGTRKIIDPLSTAVKMIYRFTMVADCAHALGECQNVLLIGSSLPTRVFPSAEPKEAKSISTRRLINEGSHHKTVPKRNFL